MRNRAARKYEVEGLRTPPDGIRNAWSKQRLAGSPEAVLKADQSEFLVSRRRGDALRKKRSRGIRRTPSLRKTKNSPP